MYIKNYNDYELLYLISEKNQQATDILYEKYIPIINYKTKKFSNYCKKIGLEEADLFQEGMIGLSEAIKNFKEEKDVKFSTFANLCVERQIFSSLKKASRKKHEFLNNALSLDLNYNEEKTTLIDFILDNSEEPSIYIENEEAKDILYKKIVENLTLLEKNVLILKINNFSYKEIGSILNKSYKSIDSTLQRIKTKVSKILKEEL